MVDYGIMSAVKTALQKNEQLKHVYLAIPPNAEEPLVLLELEEIWTSLKLGITTVHAKVNFKVKIMSRQHGKREALALAGLVKETLDGQFLVVTKGCTAVFKLTSSVLHRPNDGRLGFMEQYFEAIVR